MALNLFDEALEQLPDEPYAATGGSLFEEAQRVLSERTTAEETELRRTARGGTESPDAIVEARRLARRYDMPTPMVSRQLEEYKKRALADDVVEASKTNPRLGAWLAADPAHVAVAAPDLKSLSALDRALGIGRNIGGAALAGVWDFSQGMWGALEAASELTLGALPEKTQLHGPDEAAFQAWVQESGLADVDHEKSFYDYRGFWQDTAAREQWHPGQHFPDTYKTHGHPTFSVESQYSQGAGDGGRWEGETFVPPEPGAFAAFARGAAAVAKHLADKARGTQEGAGFLERAAYSGVESLGMMAPGMAAAFVSGGSSLLLTSAGVATGGMSYHDARAQGVAPGKALAFAGVQGAIEVATEFIPAHLLLKDLTKRSGFLTILTHQIASEIPTEEVATVLQDLNEWAVLPANKERTFQDYLDERPSAAAATAVSVLVAVGGTTVATHGTVRMLEQLGAAAQESKTLAKDPATVQSLLDHVDAQTGGVTFYAPLDTWKSYWQGKGVDPAVAAATITGEPDAFSKASEAGLLEIPAARYAVALAGTEHNTFFKNEITLDPNLHNAREAEAFAAKQEAEATTAAEEPPSRRALLRQAITQELEAGGQFKARDAAAQAGLVDAALGTMAEAAGEDPLTVYQQYGVQVVRPDLGLIPPAADLLAPAGEAIVEPVKGEVAPEAEAPQGTATFLSQGPDGPLYNWPLPDGTMTTGDAAGVKAAGFAVPETPTEQALPEATQNRLREAGYTETQIGRMGIGQADAVLRERARKRIRQLEGDVRTAQRAAETDELTGLANRAALNKALPAAEADPETRVVAFDANNFGQVNKQVGHAAGDAMLQTVGTAIQAAATEFGAGARVFRRGGDEFVVLAPAAVADQIRARAEALFGEQTAGTVTVSLSGTTGATFAEADATLQAAKATRKSTQAGDQAVTSLTTTGVASGPGGLRVRVVPKATPGHYELEITEKGNRRFEGDFPLEQGPALGAARLAALIASPTVGPVTPQIVPAKPDALTDDTVAAWVDEVKARIGGLQEFRVSIDGAGDLHLETIVVDQRAQGAGLGAIVMRELTAFADQHRTRIVLTPTPLAEHGSTSAERLTAFYERFGFVKNDGETRDFSIAAGMYREPATGGYVLAPFASTPAQRQPKARKGKAVTLEALIATPTLPAVDAPQTASAEALDASLAEPVASAVVEAQTKEDDAQQDDLDGGATLGAGDTGEPARRPGDARAAELAREQPEQPAAISEGSGVPARPRKRRPAKGRPDVRRGAAAPRAGQDAGGGGGVHPPEHVDTADLADHADVAAAEARGEAPRHFVIDDTASLTEGGWTVKLEANLAAIRLLKALDREGRMATDAEQAILTRYIGWGHTELKDIVEFAGEGNLEDRDPRKQKARDELEQLLTRAEIQELGESTPNAHYSFADLPRAMWTAVERLGFTGGTILEPAVGIGHFVGTMPGALRASKRTRLAAVEKEPIAAGIARQLYQDVHVQNSPLQEANLPDNYYDLIISNVPFGRIPIFDPAFTSTERRPIAGSVHNYYFGKALDLVRPGGLVAFVTSRYTMDARSDAVRQFIADRADLLGAVRLPDQAFKKTAGTDVVTDILFLQKRAEGQAAKRGSQAWVESPVNAALSTTERPIHTSAYFQAHPDHVLGTENLSGKMARTNLPQYNVQGTLTLDDLVAGLTRALPERVYKASKTPPRKLAAVVSRDVKQGSYQLEGGKLFLYDKGTLAPSELTGAALERAKTFVPLRDAYQAVLDTMIAGGTDAELAAAQKALLGKYKGFVASHGLVNEAVNRRVIEEDPNAGRILALENFELVRTKGRPAKINLLGLADIFTKRTYTPVVEATTADSPDAALTQSLAWKGGVDLPYMAALTGKSETAIAAELAGAIYRDPVTRAYQPRAEYLSGDVTTKLAQAQAAAATDATYADNVTALTAVLPRQFTPEDFPVPFGATWVPLEIYQQFVAAETHTAPDITLVNTEQRVKFYVEGGHGMHEFLPAGSNLNDWIAAALNGELPRLKSGDPATFDLARTEAYRESLKQLRERWAEWWPADPVASETLTKIYNGMFNRDTPYVADGSYVVLPNANPHIKMRPWQNNVIARALQVGNTLLAHVVGSGKTYAMAAIAGEWKRLRLANKPMIVVPNHLTEQWRREFLELYPAARILVPTKEDFTPGNRRRLTARIANNDWDVVVMAESQFLRISVKLETLRAFIKEQEDQLLADGAAQMNMSAEDFQELVTDYGAGDKDAVRTLSSRNAPRSVKDIARGILTLRARLQKRLDQAGKDAPVTFEELGVDGLLVDEAHLYKNLYFSTAKNNIAGLKGSDSDRAMDMFLKVRHINKASNGRNVIFATGTPVSNAISELYTMFRYLAQPTLDRLGMAGFDSWANGNAEASAEMEKAAGTGYKERTRLRKWTNLRELSALFRRFADVVTTEDLVKSGHVTLPKMKGGSPTVIALDAHPDMPVFMSELDARIEALKSGKVDPKDDNHLLITTQAALAAIDLRLVKPGAAADPNGRIPTAAKEIATRYKASTATKGVQLVFLDVGIPDKKRMPPLPVSVTSSTIVLEAPTPEVDEEDADDVVDLEAEADAAMAEIAAAGFSRDLYADVRARLVAQGVKDDEIAYIHQAQTPYEQGQLFAAVNDGRIRVLLASTAKGGTGMNVQKKLTAIHHLDVPWRPADIEQRNGRIFRQGNENAEAEEIRYVTKASFDEYRWGVLATKQHAIVSLLKGELTSLDDIDPAQLDMQVAQALASGDPRTLQMLTKERQVRALQTRYLAYTRRLNAARRGMTAGLDAIDRLTQRTAAVAATVTEAQTWAATRALTVVNRVARYGAEPEGRAFALGDTDARKGFQDRIEHLMTSEPYEDSADIGEGGPYVLTLNRTHTEQWQAGEIERQTAYFLTVKAQVGGERLVLGSTPTWTKGDEKFPQFARSLDTYLDPDRLVKLGATIAGTIANYEEDNRANQEIAAKPFGQLDQLKQAEGELSELRVALGISQGAPQANVEGASFDQPAVPQPPAGEERRRGNIAFGVDPATGLPRTVINLLAGSDLSTALHEFAHFFLEVFGDLSDRVAARDAATRTPEQTRLLEDYDAMLRELGVTSRREIGTEQHEQWAEAFETYLRDGQAPSLELAGSFARFRSWLLEIYRSLRGRVPVSPTLKGIFDRMLASEEEIAAAERDTPALFTTADEAGMTPQRFALYQADVEDAHRSTRAALDREIVAEVRRERAAEWQTAKAAMAVDVAAAVEQQPVYRALKAMREGVATDADTLPAPVTFDRAALEALVGAPAVAALPADLTTTEDGMEPELLAELVGFSSADALVKAITAAPAIGSVIAAETDRRMAAEHGSMLTDGTLHEKARAARANADHDALIRAEIKALWTKHEQRQRAYERRWLEAEAKLRIAIAEGRKQVKIDALTAEVQALKAKARGGAALIRRAQPRADTLKRLAEARIAGTTIRTLNPASFWAAARRAATEAIDRAAKQDFAGAIEAKTRQLTNLAFYTEAARVKGLIDTARAWVEEHDRKPARAKLGLAGAAYLDQWDGLLARFEFKRVSDKVLERRSALATWLAHVQGAEGLPAIDLPAIVLDEMRRANFSTLTVEEFFGVTDGLRQLAHLAGLKNRLLRRGAKRELEEVAEAIDTSIRAYNPVRATPLEFTPTDERHRKVADWFASHAKIARLARALDGHRDGGVFWEHIIRPINEAADAQVARKLKAGTEYGAILERFYPGRELGQLRVKQAIPAIQGSLTKEARLAVALNWGNEQNQQRILSDPRRRWDRRQVEAILDTLDRRDWDFVQATWDYIDTFWPEIAAKQSRVTGLAPEKVQALPVSTKHGEYRGGYYPLQYDGRLSLRAGQHEIAADLKLASVGNYVSATTKRGHTEARQQNVHLSVKLDLGVVFNHLEAVIHDLTHHEMLIDVSRVLRAPAVQTAILETKGDLVYQQFTRALLDIAIDTMPARGVLEQSAVWLRAGTQISVLGFYFWTGVQQPLGLFNGASRVGPVWVARGLKRWLRDAATLQNTAAWIVSVSPMMKHRSSTATQDLSDLHRELRRPGGWFDGLVRAATGDRVNQQTITDSFLWHIGLMQRVADIPTWLGQYEKSMAAGELEERAFRLADQAVLDSQGGGQIKDLAQVQRGGPIARLYMTFYSYGSTVLNSTADVYGATRFKSPASVATFLGHLSLLYVMPAMATIALSRVLGRSGGDEDDEEAVLWDVAQEILATAMNTIVGLRELSGLVRDTGARGYAGPAGARLVDTLYRTGQQIEQGEIDEGLLVALNSAAGVIFRYPAGQVQRTVDGWVALMDGQTTNPAALLVGTPPKAKAN